jgi:hypothetical protein
MLCAWNEIWLQLVNKSYNNHIFSNINVSDKEPVYVFT